MDDVEVFAKINAFTKKAHEWGEQIPAGIFLDNRAVSTFGERIAGRIPSYLENPPCRRPIADGEGRPVADLAPIFDKLRMT
jgi:hypothetical protein